MWKVGLVCFLLLWATGESNEQECPSCLQNSNFNFSIASKRNKTGHLVAQVSWNHGGIPDENREWTINVEHIRTKDLNTETIQLVATVTAPPWKAHHGYDFVSGLGYYRFDANFVTWPVAWETCAKENAHLLILNSKDEFEAVKKMWNKYPNIASDGRTHYLHIGLTDNVQEGQFYTLLGEHINSTGYPNWAPNEPDSGNTANCAAVNRDGFFRDSYCTNQFAFVCEFSM